MDSIALIMLCAGSGERFKNSISGDGAGVKKQWLRVGDKPLWLFSLNSLLNSAKLANISFKEIIVACDDPAIYERFINQSNIKFIKGGQTRQQSLLNAINAASCDWVLTSDAARASVPSELVAKIIAAKSDGDCVVPVLRVSDAAILASDHINKEDLKLIQTPQLSRLSLLKEALNKAEQNGILYSDDSGAIAGCGGKIWFVKGDEKARKITTKEDLAHLSLPAVANESFSGCGYDSHTFTNGDFIILGGEKIAFNSGFLAHSDGDVLAHAIIDAVLGAAGLGDIGEHFSDQDPLYKNADSLQLLSRAVNLVRSYGFEIINIDASIIAEAPKISPYKSKMAKNIAASAKISPFRVNIKATTNEKMGFIGRGEGIAAVATASLRYIDWQEL